MVAMMVIMLISTIDLKHGKNNRRQRAFVTLSSFLNLRIFLKLAPGVEGDLYSRSLE